MTLFYRAQLRSALTHHTYARRFRALRIMGFGVWRASWRAL